MHQKKNAENRRIEEIKVIKKLKEHVSDFPPIFDEDVRKRRAVAITEMFQGNLQEAESILKKLYSDIQKKEEGLPKGKKFHKGTTLYWWGMSLFLQESQVKKTEGYEKFLLAFIEDLLDYSSYKRARQAPACLVLKKNPAFGKSLLNLIQKQVEKLRAKNQLPKDPEEVLNPLSEETREALDQPFEANIEQIKPALEDWLEKRGPKEKRVFIGGNYRNIAILNWICTMIQDIKFIPVMALNFPETSKPTYEKLIHDISIEMLRKCSYAIFEVTFSNGHLMEIERAKDFPQLKTILVYQIKKHEERPTITSMLMTNKFLKKGYRNFTELTIEINQFLSS